MRVIHFATTSIMHKAFVLPLARYQRAHGITVEFGSGEDLPPGYFTAIPELEAAGFPVRVVRFPYPVRPLADAVALLRLWRFFRRERYDVVHTYTSKAGILVRTAAWLAGAPRILHTAYDFHFRHYPRGPRRWLFRLAERTAARFTDLVLCSAEVIRDEAVRERIAPAGRVKVIGGPVADLQRFTVVPGEAEGLARGLGLAQGAMVVATVCRLVDYKGVDTLLHVARRVLERRRDVQFVIVGGGPLEPELRRMADSLGIAKQVVFAGFRADDRDVVRVLTLATVFCLPTRREGFGVSFAEAMAMGCPVVGPRMEPVTSVVADGVAGLLVTPENVEAYAEAILRLLGDEALRRRLGEAGRRRVREQFDPQRMYRAVTDLYDGISAA